jgi:hypothetical protein
VLVRVAAAGISRSTFRKLSRYAPVVRRPWPSMAPAHQDDAVVGAVIVPLRRRGWSDGRLPAFLWQMNSVRSSLAGVSAACCWTLCRISLRAGHGDCVLAATIASERRGRAERSRRREERRDRPLG